MKKILFTAILVGLFTQTSIQAQTQKLDVELRGETLVIKMPCDYHRCFFDNVEGMADNNEEAELRSKEFGAGIQYMAYDKRIFDEFAFDPVVLGQELTWMWKYQYAPYFKEHSNLNGPLIIGMTLLPGYKTPFQFDVKNLDVSKLSSEDIKGIKNTNKKLFKSASCNKNKMCGLLIFDLISFNNEDSNFDKDDYLKFAAKAKENNFEHYPQKVGVNKPLKIYIGVGTNGYRMTEEEFSKILNKIRKQ